MHSPNLEKNIPNDMWIIIYPGLLELWGFFFQQIMHYFLANYAPQIPNYARTLSVVIHNNIT